LLVLGQLLDFRTDQAHGQSSCHGSDWTNTYAVVGVQFVWRFERMDSPSLDIKVDTTFILYIKDGVPKIVFQLEHEDFHESLRAHGVTRSD
jgi:hypothetical protein